MSGRLPGMKTRLVIATAVVLLVTTVARGDEEAERDFALLFGRVTIVANGDLIKVLTEGKEVWVRLVGINAPKKGQPSGNKAKQALSNKILGKSIMVTVAGKDRNKRTLGCVYFLPRCNSTYCEWKPENIMLWMVKNGHARHDKKHALDNQELHENLAAAEKEAREAKRGLWAGENRKLPK